MMGAMRFAGGGYDVECGCGGGRGLLPQTRRAWQVGGGRRFSTAEAVVCCLDTWDMSQCWPRSREPRS